MSAAYQDVVRPRKVLVVGGGPVGSLTALSLHKRGWSVEMWETRDDPRGRTIAMTNLRSINLNISSRGLSALESVEPALADLLLSESIPMPSRMIHHLDGRMEAQLYDPLRGNCSNSISRSVLNQRLIEALPEGIDIKFNTKLMHVDFDTNTAYGVATARGAGIGEETAEGAADLASDKIQSKFDLIVGADGSWSKVRGETIRAQRTDFSQHFIDHAYIELHMPPDPSKPDGFAMPPNHLHIWPRQKFMLIALPNKDCSFTLTLFIPFAELAKVRTREQATVFFDRYFPSAVKIVGPRIVDDFLKNPRGNLVTISVTPSTFSSHAVLLGDACHSMVPFYGQGLNCGLEDVRVLGAYLDNYGVKGTTDLALGETDPELEIALSAYSREREADLKAITELAMSNYVEMRSSVLSVQYHLRRSLDWVLTRVWGSRPKPLGPGTPFPTQKVKGWTALYDMVTFRPDIGYAEALRRERWQKKIVSDATFVSSAAIVSVVGFFAWRAAQPWLRSKYGN